MDYVKFDSVDNKYLNDINSFSEKYYWENQYYTDSTYIKGDFSNSFKYYDNYYKENKTDNNISSYDLVTNNCSTVVLNGLKKGVLKDGTTVRDFIITDLNTDNSLIGSPNSIMKSLQNIFYNSEFTQAASHKVINDMLWQRRNGVWWNRSWYHASRLEKLY